MPQANAFRSKKDVAYDFLHTAILTNDLKPGARLVIDELAAQLGVSQIPIREVLQQLQADGLMDRLLHDSDRFSQQNRFFHLSLCNHASTFLLKNLRQQALNHWDRLRCHYLNGVFCGVLCLPSKNTGSYLSFARPRPGSRRMDRPQTQPPAAPDLCGLSGAELPVSKLTGCSKMDILCSLTTRTFTKTARPEVRWRKGG